MRNQRGFVTVEFLVAMVIAFGLTVLTFSLSLTLSVVEVSQYAVFSASRAHSAGNYDIDAQKKAAQTKYGQLIGSAAMAPLFSNGWYEISSPNQLEIRSGAGVNFEREYGGNNNRKNLQGVRATLKAKILELRLPLIGNVSPEDDGFSTRLNAILIREVSQRECQDYMDQRREELWRFDGGSRFSRFRKTTELATPWEDNGC
jgi:Flp pilus assembly protein TadG